MKWSVPFGRVAGIPIRVHFSFLLLVGWIAWLGWEPARGPESSLWAVALILSLFFCVVLHELGHSLVAIRFGAEVRSVTLYPIGGVARMSGIPEKPYQELLVSLAGPSVNVVIFLVLSLFRGGFPSWIGIESFPSSWGGLLDALIRANAILAVFNLLPAFPMDGGRVMRSLLAMFLPFERATSVAATLGQLLAVGFILLGLSINPFLVVIGFFVFFGAESEDRAVRIRHVLHEVEARDVMVTDFSLLHPDDTVGRCLEYVHHHRQDDFAVEHEGRIVGVLARKDWLGALHREGQDVPVRDIMNMNFISLDARTPLSRAYADLVSMRQGVFPVMKDRQIVGILTADDISRFLLVAEAKKSGAAPQRTEPSRDASSSPFSIDFG